MRALSIILLTISFNSYGQKQANTWYFGADGAGLDFNECPPVVLTDGHINGFEGVATISDKITGQFLFSTNSEWIWNRNQDTIPNSHLMPNGSTVTQVMIIQKPGFDSLYYVITPEVQAYSGQGYRFHCIDMTMNGGLGGVAFKDSFLYPSPVTEKITAVRHANGTDIWLIGHTYDSNNFLSFLLTSSGINTTPVVSPIGKINGSGNGTIDAIGELKASPDGSKLAAVTLYHPNIELFDFNNSTGQLSNLITLPENGGYDSITGNASGLYGLAFSPGNSFLYASEWCNGAFNTPGKIIQYDITSNDSATINNSRVNVFTATNEFFYSVKLAPDGKMYVGHTTTSNYLGVINFPDSAGINCTYVDSGIYLNGKHSGWGLNNLMEYGYYCNLPVSVASDVKVCEKLCISFQDTSTNNPTSWQWTFDGGTPASSNDQNPANVCYNNPGVFDVSLITTSATGNDTTTYNGLINVYATPSPPSITKVGDMLTSSPAYAYQWQLNLADIPGATNQSYMALSDGYYTVVAYNENNCFATSTLFVQVTGIGDVTASGAFSIFPNPNNGIFYCESFNPGQSVSSVRVYDARGREVYHKDLSDISKRQPISIDIADCPPGIYFLEFDIDHFLIQQKVILLN